MTVLELKENYKGDAKVQKKKMLVSGDLNVIMSIYVHVIHYVQLIGIPVC